MDLLIILGLFAAYVMLPAWAAETATIRRLPHRRIYTWLAIGSVLIAATAGICYHRALEILPSYFQGLATTVISMAFLLVCNFLLMVEAYTSKREAEPRGFEIVSKSLDDSDRS